jgi:hypothetical protein
MGWSLYKRQEKSLQKGLPATAIYFILQALGPYSDAAANLFLAVALNSRRVALQEIIRECQCASCVR